MVFSRKRSAPKDSCSVGNGRETARSITPLLDSMLSKYPEKYREKASGLESPNTVDNLISRWVERAVRVPRCDHSTHHTHAASSRDAVATFARTRTLTSYS